VSGNPIPAKRGSGAPHPDGSVRATILEIQAIDLNVLMTSTELLRFAKFPEPNSMRELDLRRRQFAERLLLSSKKKWHNVALAP
jgi:hypothetical protein